MATDEGVRDLYIKRLRKAIEDRKDQIAPLREKKQLVKLEDSAQASLTVEQNTLLADQKLVDVDDLTVIQSGIDRLQLEIDTIQALITSVKQVA